MTRRKRFVADENVEENVGDKSPDEEDLYSVLGVERSASQDEIRKAYHKLALRLHPDKNPGDESAKERFQSLQSVIGILGDPEKRKIYDETGSTEDVELSGEKFASFCNFFKALFKQVNEEDIDAFSVSYRGSEEEKTNLKEEYMKREGEMNLVFFYLMCSDPKLDSHRFKDIIDLAISEGEVKEFKVYRKWAKAVSKQPAPLNPLKTSRSTSTGDATSLVALLQRKSKDRMNTFTSTLEAKYGGTKDKKGVKSGHHELSEEDFQATQSRLMKKAKRRGVRQD